MQLSADWLALEEKLGYRPLIKGTVEEIRDGYSALCQTLASTAPPADPSVHSRQFLQLLPLMKATLITSARLGDEKISEDLLVRIYTPNETRNSQVLPIGVYAHGGGFVAGSVDAHFEDRNCRYIAQHAPCIIVSVVFRLAPEFPVPQQLYDYLKAYNWVWEHAEELGGIQSQCFSIGASVGAGLAISVALKLIERGHKSRIAGVVSLAPSTLHPDYVPDEFKDIFVAYEDNKDGPLINREAMYVFYSHNGATKQKQNPDVFPALHPRLAELPPTYIATCGADPVRDDGTIISHVLDMCGARNKHKNYEALPHFFWIYPEIPAGDEFRADSAEAVNFILGR